MKISVVIPAKDDAEMLERCLASLSLQRRKADEIIVVDNNSSDATASVAASHGVRILFEARPGITAAASAGYDAVTGDVIARCDADSVCPRDWLARIERLLKERPDAVAVTGRGRFYDLRPASRMLADLFYMRAYFFVAGAAIANTPLFGSNFAMRSDAWREVSASVPRDDRELHDDFDLSYRLAPDAVVIYDPDLLVGISGRPFRDLRAMRKRVAMARATMRAHLPAQRPTVRWRHRLAPR